MKEITADGGATDEDARVTRFREAERRLWEYYDVEPTEGTVLLGDPPVAVRYWEVGSGPPALFVHGGTAVGSTWTPLVSRIEGRRCIVIDRPGCGLSEPIDYRGMNVRELLVGSITGVLDELGVDSAALVGNSLGGTAAFHAALDRPERAASVVQAGTPLFLPGARLPLWFRLLSVRGLNRLLLRLQPPSQKQVRSLHAQVGHGESVAEGRIPEEYFDMFYAYERLPETGLVGALSQIESGLTVRGPRPAVRLTDELLAAVDQPTLFVLGDDDPFGGPVVGRRAVETMPDATVERLAGGHLPLLDRPEACGRLVSAFLAQSVKL